MRGELFQHADAGICHEEGGDGGFHGMSSFKRLEITMRKKEKEDIMV